MKDLDEIISQPEIVNIRNIDKVRFSNFVVFGFYEKPFKNGNQNIIKDILKFKKFFKEYHDFRKYEFVNNCSMFNIFPLDRQYNEDEIYNIIKLIENSYC